MAVLQTRSNTNIYLKAPSGTAFATGDILPAAQVYDLSTPLTAANFEFGGYGSTYIQRVTDLRDATFSFGYDVDPADTKLATILTAWNSTSMKVDIMVVNGDEPAAAAVNFVVYGRFVLTNLSADRPLPGVVRLTVEGASSDGLITVASNVTAMPSLAAP